MRIFICFLLNFAFHLITASSRNDNGPIPIVMWHGMGDTCCNPLSMGSIKHLLEENIPEVNVTSLMIGSNIIQDFEAGYFTNVNDQIDFVCNQLQQRQDLQNGYNAIGFSQGGLFMRGLAQKCPVPPMVNLISIGGPQQGVYGFPKCPGTSSTICDMVRRLLNFGAYSWIQKFLVQAEYWQDPLDLNSYRNYSVYLADINNERKKKEEYKQNLLKLQNLVLVLFTKDTMVQPKESEWFGFYQPGQAKEVQALQDSPIYNEVFRGNATIRDWIGLKQLNESGRLQFLSVDGDHLQIEEQWFIDNIITPFLNNTQSTNNLLYFG